MNLWEYEFQNVKIVDVDGDVFTGFALCYTSTLDDPDGIENISIRENLNSTRLIEFTAAEIAKIEIIEPTENLNIPKLQPAKELQPA
ncbi:MAG: hypothetical protein FWG64_00260 [Firmicutes bacterium]|nr:hypothetical protein [Bacillota bacterium]